MQDRKRTSAVLNFRNANVPHEPRNEKVLGRLDSFSVLLLLEKAGHFLKPSTFCASVSQVSQDSSVPSTKGSTKQEY